MAEFDYKPGFAKSLEINKDYRQKERGEILAWLKPKKNEVIVDFGGGNGYVAEYIAPYCKRVIILDPSQQLLAHAPKNPKIETILISDDGTLPLEAESVEVILTVRAIHHVRNYHTVFAEFNRILKPAGRLLIADIPEGSVQAEHFDAIVSLYCKAGHHRAWLNKTYVESLCKKHRFKLQRLELGNTWIEFNSKQEAAKITKLWHDLSLDERDIITILEKHGLKSEKNKQILPWPLLFALATKEEAAITNQKEAGWWFNKD